MALEANIGGHGELFVGEDKIFRLEVIDTTGNPVDVATWDVHFIVRKNDNSADALIDKSSTVIGTYNAVRATNTQRREVQLTDTEMNTVTARRNRHSWKRMDDGSETVLAYGNFAPQLATAR